MRALLVFLSLAAAILATSGGCRSPIAFASKQAVPLTYVGSLACGEPITRGRHLVIPLLIDYRTGEWAMNSARGAYGTASQIEGRTIIFSVLTSLPSKAALEIHVPKPAPGEYALIYVDPDGTRHELKRINVKP